MRLPKQGAPIKKAFSEKCYIQKILQIPYKIQKNGQPFQRQENIGNVKICKKVLTKEEVCANM